MQRGMDKVVIEVAARSTPVAQPMPQMHIPQMYPGMVNAVHMEVRVLSFFFSSSRISNPSLSL